MAKKLFYFTGTGNTLFIARKLAEQLGETAIEPIMRANPVIDDSIDTIGIIFPVFGWGMPDIVGKFVDRLENVMGKYVFAVCNYGGTLFASLKTVERRLMIKGVKLDAGFAVRMPVNYIPLFRVLSSEKEGKILARATRKIAAIAPLILQRKKKSPEQWHIPIVNDILLVMHEKMMKNIFGEDRAFKVTEKCNGCRTCMNVCPVANIAINNNHPVWNHACQQCLACLHWCPQAAIQYGKVPAERGRYHNREIMLQDMMEQQVVGAPESDSTGTWRVLPD